MRSPLKGRHTTADEHTPEKHRKMGQWSPERFIRWATTIGPDTAPGKAGVTIAEVAPGSLAARNGLRPGDVIVQAGSTLVSNPNDVAGAVRAAASGDKPILLLVERGDHRRYVAIELDRG